jgi:hypothetical protein
VDVPAGRPIGEQGGEIKNAHVFRNQLFIIVGSLALTAGLLILLAAAMNQGIGQDGILVASSGYWYLVPEATIAGTFMMPNLIAMGLTTSPILIAIIGFGYILNSFQIVVTATSGRRGSWSRRGWTACCRTGSRESIPSGRRR